MTTELGTTALVRKFADEIISRLDKSYDLVYVDYRDQLSDSQVAKLVRGDEWLDESFEWESDNRYESAKQIIADLAKEVIADWERETDDADLDFVREAFEADADEHDRVRFTIDERDSGSWVEQLTRQTPAVLLRIEAIDEDHAYSFEPVKPRRVLKDLGVRATRANVETVNYILANASPEYGVLMGYWIVGADVSDISDLPYDADAEVEIVNPYLYLGNPFAGSGFISEQPLEAIVRVKRSDLRTDADAFGYSVNEVYGGLIPSQFECELRAA